MMSSGILINIRFTFNKEKRGHVRYLQVLSSTFETPSTKRNEDMKDVLRYSQRYSKYLLTRETKTCMMASGIPNIIRITFRQEKPKHV